MEGILFKKTKSRNFNILNSWTQLYFILNSNTKELTYFQESKGKRSYRGQVSIENAKLANCIDSGKPFSFELTALNASANIEIIILAANTELEMINWINSVCLLAPCKAEWIQSISNSTNSNSETKSDLNSTTQIPAPVPPPPPPPPPPSSSKSSSSSTTTIPTSTQGSIPAPPPPPPRVTSRESSNESLNNTSKEILNQNNEKQENIKKETKIPYLSEDIDEDDSNVPILVNNINEIKDVKNIQKENFNDKDSHNNNNIQKLNDINTNVEIEDDIIDSNNNNDNNNNDDNLSNSQPSQQLFSQPQNNTDLSNNTTINSESNLNLNPINHNNHNNHNNHDNIEQKQIITEEPKIEEKIEEKFEEKSNKKNDPRMHLFLRESSGYNFEKKVEKMSTSQLSQEPPIIEDNDDNDVNDESFKNQLKTYNNIIQSNKTIPILTPNEKISWKLSWNCYKIFPTFGDKLFRRSRLYFKLYPQNNSQKYKSNLSSSRSNLLDFNRVKEVLIADENENENENENNQYHIPLSFPYLPSTGCSWSDILKYLKYIERNQATVDQSVEDYEINLTNNENYVYYFNCILRKNQLNSEEVQFNFTTSSQPWYNLLIEKILSLNIQELNQLDSITNVINESIYQMFESISHTMKDQVTLCQKYTLIQEEIYGNIKVDHEEGDHSDDDLDYDEEYKKNVKVSLNKNSPKDDESMIHRSEWRKWMAEKEDIIKKNNYEKRRIIQENQNLRTALDASSEQVFNLLQDASEKIEKLRIDLENSQTEVEKLKMELSLCYKQLQEYDLTPNNKSFNLQKEKQSFPKEKNYNTKVINKNSPKGYNKLFKKVNDNDNDDDFSDNFKGDSTDDSDYDKSKFFSNDDDDNDNNEDDYDYDNINLNSNQKNNKNKNEIKIADLTQLPSQQPSTKLKPKLQLKSQLKDQQRKEEQKEHITQKEYEQEEQFQSLNKPNGRKNSIKLPNSRVLDKNKQQQQQQQQQQQDKQEEGKIEETFLSSNEHNLKSNNQNKIEQKTSSTNIESPQNIQTIQSIKGDIISTPEQYYNNNVKKNNSSNFVDDVEQYPYDIEELSHHSLDSFRNSIHNDESNYENYQPSISPSFEFQDQFKYPYETPNHQEENFTSSSSPSWIHNYLTSVKDVRRNSLSNSVGNNNNNYSNYNNYNNINGNEGNEYCLPLNLNQKQYSLSNLPPAINETLISSIPDDYSPSMKQKKPLCRDTLIIGREHGLFGKKEDDEPLINDYYNQTQQQLQQQQQQNSGEKKRVHPLHLALKSNIQSNKSSPSLLGKTKTISRETQRSIPPSQRYLVGTTTASVGKLKKGISTPLGAIRGSQEWK